MRILLEELGVPYDLEVVNIRTGQQREPQYLALNPMGKVPAVKYGDEIITEQSAIYTYLPELFPEKKLAPMPGEPGRGSFLRWAAFYGASFEPAVCDKALKREPGRPSMMPYGDYDTTIGTLARHLEKAPYMLGDRFTSLDVLWGSGLGWTMMFGVVDKLPAFTSYVERLMKRPAFERAKAADEALSKQLGF